MGLQETFHIIIAWLLYYLIVEALGLRRGVSTHRTVLGVLGVFMLVLQVYDILLTVWSGYMWETLHNIKFYYGAAMIVMIPLGFVVGIAATLNLHPRFRKKLGLLWLQWVGMLLFVVLGWWCDMIRSLDFATAVIPGWHTTVMYWGTYFMVCFWLLIAWILALIIGLSSNEANA